MDILKKEIIDIMDEYVGIFFDLTFDIQLNLKQDEMHFYIYPKETKMISLGQLVAVVDVAEISALLNKKIKYILNDNISLKYIDDSIKLDYDDYCKWNINISADYISEESIIFSMEI